MKTRRLAIAGTALVIATQGVSAAAAEPPRVDGSTSVLEGRDYATELLRDPWDYSNPEDAIVDGSPLALRMTDLRIEDGALRMTAGQNAYMTLHPMAIPANTEENGDNDGALVDEHDGLRWPLEAERYRRLSMSVYASVSTTVTFQWFGCHEYSSKCLGAKRFVLSPGWQQVTFDVENQVATYPWTGDILGLRLAVEPEDEVDIAVDWLRLHGPASSLKITTTATQLFWDTDSDPSNIGDTTKPDWGEIPIYGGAGWFDVSGLPPGTYHLWADGQYGDTVTIRERPRPVIDDPDLAGGVDYATEVLHNPWDFNDDADVERLCNVRDVAWLKTATRPDGVKATGVLKATNDWIRCGVPSAERNDPWLQLPLGPDGLDPEHYHRVTWTGWFDGSFDLADDIGGGSHGRLLWRRSDTPTTPTLQYEDGREMVQYTNRMTYSYDMADETWGKTSEHADHPWTGRTINFLRFDPNEDRGARTWYLDELRLAADDAANPTFAIRWHDASKAPGDRAVVRLDTDREGFDGEILADVAQSPGLNQVEFDATNRLPATYWVNVTSTSAATGDSSQVYATGPLVVSPRIAGPGRVETSVELSRQRFPNASTAIVVDAGNFPDALSAGPLAAELDAPILLVADRLDALVSTELERLGVTRVVIVGGPKSVSPEVESALAERWKVERIAGDGREDTSAQVAERVLQGRRPATVVVASSGTFPDALAATPLAAQLDTVILLTNGTSAAPSVASAVARANPGRVLVAGGPGSVSDEVATQLAAGRPWSRLAGRDRFETGAKVFEAAVAAGADARKVLVASGERFPDALAAGAASAHEGGSLMLTAKHSVPTPTADLLRQGSGTWRSWRVVGGAGTVSHATVRTMRSMSALG